MEPLNFKKDKEGNLRMSFSGLLYLIENGYLFDKAVVHQVIDGEDNMLFFFDDEEGIDLVREESETDKDGDEILPSIFLNEDTILATYYVSKEYYSFDEQEKDYYMEDYDSGDYMEEDNNFLGSYTSEDGNMHIDYYLLDDENPLNDEEFEDLKMLFQDLFIEENSEQLIDNVFKKLDNDKKPAFPKKPTKKQIQQMVLDEHHSKDVHSLDGILKEVKRILRK